MGVLDLIGDIIKAKQNKSNERFVIKTIVKNINDNNSNNNNNNNKKNNNSFDKKGTYNQQAVKKPNIVIQNVRLYCTGTKGRVYTDEFHKAINSDFGLEAKIQNNTSQKQNVKVGHCIYNKKGNNKIFTKTIHVNVNPNSTYTLNIRVLHKDFVNIKPGEYKSQLWVNDKKIEGMSFSIRNK